MALPHPPLEAGGSFTRPAPIEMHRLSTESYSKLAAKMPPIYVDAETTALQASFQLGVQHVLKQLREGWVVG